MDEVKSSARKRKTGLGNPARNEKPRRAKARWLARVKAERSERDAQCKRGKSIDCVTGASFGGDPGRSK